MKQKLQRIQSPFRRLIVSLLINACVWISTTGASRAQVHWTSSPRPRRRERPLFALLIGSAWTLLESHEFVLWSALGGGIAIFLVQYMLYQFFPRKRAQWVSFS